MKISGIVKDGKTGEPIVGVNIIVQKEQLEGDIPFFTGAATDSEGKFVTPKLSKGTYEIKFRNIGYEEKIETILIKRKRGTLLLDAVLMRNL